MLPWSIISSPNSWARPWAADAARTSPSCCTTADGLSGAVPALRSAPWRLGHSGRASAPRHGGTVCPHGPV